MIANKKVRIAVSAVGIIGLVILNYKPVQIGKCSPQLEEELIEKAKKKVV